jgi:hypothetical protein
LDDIEFEMKGFQKSGFAEVTRLLCVLEEEKGDRKCDRPLLYL